MTKSSRFRPFRRAPAIGGVAQGLTVSCRLILSDEIASAQSAHIR
jgi:hypothetical protein